jgi:hypothetical protein
VSQIEEYDFESPKSAWLTGPYLATSLELDKILGAKTHVYDERKPPANDVPSSIIYYPIGEDVAADVRCLQALAPGAPILVLGFHLEPQLARVALLAGANGFIHRGMQPEQIQRILSAVSEGETVVSRGILDAFLEEMLSRGDLIVLTPRQRDFLELVAGTSMSQDEIVVPRELLEAFLIRAVAA